MTAIVVWAIVLVPLLVLGGIVAWFLGKPAWEARQVEERAAAGDPAAQAAIARSKRAESVMQRLLRGEDPERRRLLAFGKSARAIITDVRPLGIDVGSEPVQAHLFDVTLTIGGEGGAPYNVTICDAVSVLHAARLVRGASVPVRIDPSDAQKVIVVWDAP